MESEQKGSRGQNKGLRRGRNERQDRGRKAPYLRREREKKKRFLNRIERNLRLGLKGAQQKYHPSVKLKK